MNPEGQNFDRIFLTLLVAAVFHAFIIFGVKFTYEINQQKQTTTIDVTLSKHQSDQSVVLKDADYLAEYDNIGSGTLEKKQQLKSIETSEIADNQAFRVTPTVTQLNFRKKQKNLDTIISSQKSNNRQPKYNNEQGNQAFDLKNPVKPSLSETSEVATLQAEFSKNLQEYAKSPRVRVVTSLTTKSAIDAAYTYKWLKKVERIGNQNYPEVARQNRLTGLVQMLVTLSSDGSVKSVEIAKSSGHSILDQTAKEIVYLSSPFDKFTPQMLENFNELVIIRSWQFKVNNRFGLSDE